MLKNNFGHTNEGVDDYDYDEFDDEKDTPDDDLTAPSDTGAFSRVFKWRLIYFFVENLRAHTSELDL